MSDVKHILRLMLNILTPFLGLLLLIFVLPKLLVFFMPFVLGYLIAFLANPLVSYLQRRLRMQRKHSSVVLTVAVLGAVIAVLYFAVTALLSGLSGVLESLPVYYEAFLASVSEILTQYEPVLMKLPPAFLETADALRTDLNTALGELIAKLASPTVSFSWSAVKSVPGLLINLLILFLSAFCFIKEWETVQSTIKNHTPRVIEQYFSYLREDLKKIFGSWLLAQLKIMGIVAIVLWAAFALLKVRYAIPLALLTAFLDFLPAFGVGFVLWPWALIEVLKSNFWMALWLMLLYFGVQVVRQTLQPKIMGDTMGLPPLWTLLFLYLGFKFYGIAGMIFAVPVGMFFLSLFRYGILDQAIASAKELYGLLTESD